MTTDNIIDLLIIACSGLFVWALAATLTLWDERREREPKATTAPSSTSSERNNRSKITKDTQL